MALKNLPDKGLLTYYADESDDKKTYVLSSVAVPTLGASEVNVPIEWDMYLNAAQEWRRKLRDKFGIPVRKELKGSKLATGRNAYQPRGKRLYGQKAIDAYAFALRELSFLPDASIFSVTCERSYSLYGHTRLEAALYGRLSEREKRLSVATLHDEIPRETLNERVDYSSSDGIKRLK